MPDLETLIQVSLDNSRPLCKVLRIFTATDWGKFWVMLGIDKHIKTMVLTQPAAQCKISVGFNVLLKMFYKLFYYRRSLSVALTFGKSIVIHMPQDEFFSLERFFVLIQ